MTATRVSLAVNLLLLAALAAIGVRWLHRRSEPAPETDFWGAAHMTATRDLHERLTLPSGSVVLLGDSLTEYGPWAELLGRPDVYNRGIAGYTVAGVAARVSRIIDAKPRLVVLMVGINDLSAGRSAREVVTGARDIVSALREGAPATRVIVQSILPVRDVGRGRVPPFAIGEANRGLESLAVELGASYLDVGSALTDSEQSLGAEFTADGVHLNGAGYERWAGVLAPALR